MQSVPVEEFKTESFEHQVMKDMERIGVLDSSQHLPNVLRKLILRL